MSQSVESRTRIKNERYESVSLSGSCPGGRRFKSYSRYKNSTKMNVNHLISDTVVRIKNGFISHKNSVSVLKSKQVLSIINVLEEEGFIKGYTENRYTLDVWLKYVEGVSVIQNIKVISKPSKRVYFSIPDLIDWRNKTNTFDILILSTTQGILTDEVALEKRVGGEILCIIK